ncbi:MAG: hypothetical protein NTZ94_16710 [Verrucomicrobia bacterium]|nr:hypothetical protein [Verrucomicrobiota bacterium]
MIKPYPRSDRDLTQEKPFALQLALKMAALALLLIGMALLFENSLTTLLFVLADVFLGVAFAVEMSEFLAKPVISVKKEQSL